MRSQIDSADRIVTKASTDTMIESMIQTILDPFNAYGNPKDQEEGHIFSILPPLSIAPPSSSNASPNHPAHTLARTRTNLSSSSATQSVANVEPEDSPASTARWADEQKRCNGSAFADRDATPKRRGKDQLSWISEHDDVPGDAGNIAEDLQTSTDNGEEATEESDGNVRSIQLSEDDATRWQ